MASTRMQPATQTQVVTSRPPPARPTPTLTTTLFPKPAAPIRPSEKEIFICSEESHFYSQCVNRLVLRNSSRSAAPTLIEFGSGDGSPIIDALLSQQASHVPFHGVIHGFELNPASAAIARNTAGKCGVDHIYQVHNSCFFEGVRANPADCLIANPPYIPAPDNDILMPALHGGLDGANLTRDLLSLGFNSAMLLLSAYSNPVETIEHARSQGYTCTDFLVTPLPWGTYSSEPKVRSWIANMRTEGKAFYTDSCYLLAGALFEKPPPMRLDVAPLLEAQSEDFLQLIGRSANSIVPLTDAQARNGNVASGGGGAAAAEPAKTDLTDQLLSVMTSLR